MFRTKTDSGKQNHQYLYSLVKRAKYLRNCARAGQPRERWQMTPAESQLVVMIEDLIEREEIALKGKTSELLLGWFKAQSKN